MSSVNLVVENNLARLELNRPEKLNSINEELIRDMVAAIDEIEKNPAIRLVLFYGNGGNFSSGLDIMSVMSNPALIKEILQEYRNGHNMIQHIALGIYELKVPVIAAIEGYCFGGGLQMALGADIRITSDNAKWSVMEGKWGIIPDMGISVSARGRVREDILLKHTLLADKFNGAYAQEVGFATEVSENPLARAEELAQELLQRSPDFMRNAKQMLRQTQDMQVLQRPKLELELQQPLLGSKNQMEAVQANLQKRPANYQDKS